MGMHTMDNITVGLAAWLIATVVLSAMMLAIVFRMVVVPKRTRR